jgi:hypothetical protein
MNQTKSKCHTAVERVEPANNAYVIHTFGSLVNLFQFVGGLKYLVYIYILPKPAFSEIFKQVL